VLVNGHKSGGKLAVLKQTVHVAIDSMEDQIAVILGSWDIKSPQRDVQFLWIQIALAIMIQHAEGINEVKVISQ